jgi:hypothetical protein
MTIAAIPFPIFQPAMRIITAITNSNPAIVTTSFNNQYISGTIVRLDIPLGFGMQQMNQQFAPITVLSPTSFSIAIDSTSFDSFIVPGGNLQYAQSVAIGEISQILTAAVQNVLPYPAS